MKKTKTPNTPFVDPSIRTELMPQDDVRTEFTARLLQADDNLVLRVPKVVVALEDIQLGSLVRISIRKEGKP